MRTLKKWAVGMLFVLGVMACALTEPDVPMGDELVIAGTGFTLRPPANYRVRQLDNERFWAIHHPINRAQKFLIATQDIPDDVDQEDWLREQFADIDATPEAIMGDGFSGLAAAFPIESGDEIAAYRIILVAGHQALYITATTSITKAAEAETLLNAMLASVTYAINED